MVNSDGIAVDPRARYTDRGGELNTRPTETPEGQVEVLEEFLRLNPGTTVNYRSNLHVHVRVPGLAHDLSALKRLAAFNEKWLRRVLGLVEPIPRPLREEYLSDEQYKGAMRRYRRRRRSHHTVLPTNRTHGQLAATSVQEFLEAEVPRGKAGKPLWHCQPRAAVNVRQLRETNTIEFRHFPGTLDPEELLTCVEWCRDYLHLALSASGSPVDLYWAQYARRAWPQFRPYVHWMEVRYRATVLDGSIPRKEALRNIDQIRKGEWSDDK